MMTNPPRYCYEPAPCDDCHLNRRCASEQLACRSFLAFVNVGARSVVAADLTKRVPSPELFLALNARGK